jgi:acyl-CoA reductase-like NAD-dependent aldehyde dehydrogenase
LTLLAHSHWPARARRRVLAAAAEVLRQRAQRLAQIRLARSDDIGA